MVTSHSTSVSVGVGEGIVCAVTPRSSWLSPQFSKNHPESACRSLKGMSQMGHEDQFPPPGLNGACRLGKATFAGTLGNGRVAPVAGSRHPPGTANGVRCSAARVRSRCPRFAEAEGVKARVPSVQEASQRLASVVLGLLGHAGIRCPIEAMIRPRIQFQLDRHPGALNRSA
jgi:hypothetical protein